MNQPKLACGNILLLFLLPTCLGISYSIAEHFTSKPRDPFPQKPVFSCLRQLTTWHSKHLLMRAVLRRGRC